MERCLGAVAPDAPDEMGSRVDQCSQQIIQPRMKVLRQRGDWLVAVQTGDKENQASSR